MSSDMRFPVDSETRRRAEERLRTGKGPEISHKTEDYDHMLHLLEREIQLEDLIQNYQEIEAKLQHEKFRYQKIPVPIIFLNEKGIVTDLNDMVCSLFTSTREHILDYSFSSFFTDKEADTIEEFFNRIIEKGTKQSCKIGLKKEGSGEETICCIGIMVPDKKNSSKEMVIILINDDLCKPPEGPPISQQIAFIANLIEHTSHPFAVAYPNGQIRLSNTSFEKLLGYSSDELASLDLARDLTPNEWKETEMTKLKELFRTGHPVQYEKEYIRKDKSRVPVELYVHLVSDENGTPQYYYSFITDISKRKKIELQLKETEDRFHQLANNVEQVFWFTSLQPEQVLYVNPSFERIWGLPAEELYKNARVWTDHIHEDDKQRVNQAFTSWIKGETPEFDVEYCILNRKGQIRWIHDHGAALVKKDGVVVQVSGIAEDITNKKLTEIPRNKVVT